MVRDIARQRLGAGANAPSLRSLTGRSAVRLCSRGPAERTLKALLQTPAAAREYRESSARSGLSALVRPAAAYARFASD